MTFLELLEASGKKVSDEQLAAIMTDSAAVVSAGAGSGKTTVLSLRFVRLVLSGKAHADEILTLTFTKKAAAEMYERIYSLLSLAASNDQWILFGARLLALIPCVLALPVISSLWKQRKVRQRSLCVKFMMSFRRERTLKRGS